MNNLAAAVSLPSGLDEESIRLEQRAFASSAGTKSSYMALIREQVGRIRKFSAALMLFSDQDIDVVLVPNVDMLQSRMRRMVSALQSADARHVDPAELSCITDALKTCPMDMETLRRTKIGVDLNNLRKLLLKRKGERMPNEQSQRDVGDVLSRWKALHQSSVQHGQGKTSPEDL
ncbi:DNA 3'-5' helicase [Plasmodiophora brassicae]